MAVSSTKEIHFPVGIFINEGNDTFYVLVPAEVWKMQQMGSFYSYCHSHTAHTDDNKMNMFFAFVGYCLTVERRIFNAVLPFSVLPAYQYLLGPALVEVKGMEFYIFSPFGRQIGQLESGKSSLIFEKNGEWYEGTFIASFMNVNYLFRQSMFSESWSCSFLSPIRNTSRALVV